MKSNELPLQILDRWLDRPLEDDEDDDEITDDLGHSMSAFRLEPLTSAAIAVEQLNASDLRDELAPAARAINGVPAVLYEESLRFFD